MTPDGKAIVIDRNVLLEQLKVKLIVREAKNPDESHQLEDEPMVFSSERIRRFVSLGT